LRIAAGGPLIGFNATTNKIEDLKRLASWTRSSQKTGFMNAISVASTYLTVGAAITNVPDKKIKICLHGGHAGNGWNGRRILKRYCLSIKTGLERACFMLQSAIK